MNTGTCGSVATSLAVLTFAIPVALANAPASGGNRYGYVQAGNDGYSARSRYGYYYNGRGRVGAIIGGYAARARSHGYYYNPSPYANYGPSPYYGPGQY
jgi:hypothetical protein